MVAEANAFHGYGNFQTCLKYLYLTSCKSDTLGLTPYGTNTTRRLNGRNLTTSSTYDTAVLPCTLGNLPSSDRLTAAVSRMHPLDGLTPVCYPTGTRCQDIRDQDVLRSPSSWHMISLEEKTLARPCDDQKTLAPH